VRTSSAAFWALAEASWVAAVACEEQRQQQQQQLKPFHFTVSFPVQAACLSAHTAAAHYDCPALDKFTELNGSTVQPPLQLLLN
jgi:hypothetical protein